MRKAEQPQFRIFVDGSSRGNPGPAGVGIAVFTPQQDETITQISKYIGITTNNVAEYEAVIHALKWMVQTNTKSAQLMLDSELVYKQLTGEYRVKSSHITFLIKRIKMLKSNLSLEFILVPRENNKLANQLAQKASKKVKVKHQKFKQLPL